MYENNNLEDPISQREFFQQYPATISKNLLLEYATGVGKSKAAINCVKKKALIVHHRVVHKKNWEEEIKKWGADFDREYITYATLARNKKIQGEYDTVIVDECHHVTDKNLPVLKSIKNARWIFLSATVPYDKRKLLSSICNYETIKVSINDAIKMGILPKPKIYIVQCHLDGFGRNFTYRIKLNRNTDTEFQCTYSTYKRYLNSRQNLAVQCTQSEYLIMLNDQIEYLKKKYFASRQEHDKFRWLAAASDRKKFISYTKTIHVKNMLMNFKDARKIVFSHDIDQSMAISRNSQLCIDSKNGNYDLVEKFNNKEVNSLYAVGVLNEGMNIYDLDYAFIVALSGTEISNIQRLGRSFRSKEPEVFIFVVPNSRDQEYYEALKEELGDYMITIQNYDDFKRVQRQGTTT